MNQDMGARSLGEGRTGSSSIDLAGAHLEDLRNAPPRGAWVDRQGLDVLAHVHRVQARARPGIYLASVRGGSGAGPTAGDLGGIQAVLGDYGLSGTRATDVARCWMVALQGFMVMELQGAVGSAVETERAFLRLVDMLDAHALAAAGRPRRGGVKQGRAGSRPRPEPAARHP